MFRNIKGELNNPTILQLLVASAYDNSMENAYKKAEEFHNRHNWSIYGWVENEEIIGVCGSFMSGAIYAKQGMGEI